MAPFFYKVIMIEKIKELRKQTNMSLNECKKALEKAGGSVSDALVLLQGVQAKDSDKRKNKVAKEGRIEAYVHTGNQIGCMVEVNCETDFAARSDEFIKFCENLSLQIVALQPIYVSRDDISNEQVLSQREILKDRLSDFLRGKGKDFVEDLINQRVKDWYREVVLLEQTSVVNQSKTIKELLDELSAQLGEKVVISRFEKWVINHD